MVLPAPGHPCGELMGVGGTEASSVPHADKPSVRVRV